MPNVLKEIFGDTKRISILEELIENWGEYLTIDEIARIAKTSPKTTYRHINELQSIGILDQIDQRPKKFKFKENDKRAVALAILESEEFIRKSEISIEKAESEEEIVKEHQKSFFEIYKADKTDFETSIPIYSLIKAE